MTLTIPVSSSRLRNTVPLALSGRWRWVTTPPDEHPAVGLGAGQPPGGDHPQGVEPGPGQLHGAGATVRPVAHMSAATSSTG